MNCVQLVLGNDFVVTEYSFLSIFPIPYSYDIEVLILLWIFTKSVGLLGRVIGPLQGLYLNTRQHENRKPQTHTRHSCPKWDSNPLSQRPSERR
jgi:hypothetical protein